MLNIYQSTIGWAKSNKLNFHSEVKMSSTNVFAKELKKNFDFIVTDHQSEGKGRGKNNWENPSSGHGLMCSFVFNFKKTPQPIATTLVGLSLYNSLNDIFHQLNWSIKAPNDIWLEDKKIGGILCETINKGDQHKLIIGVGLNFLSHPNIDCATSLSNVTFSEEVYFDFLNSLYSELKSTAPQFLLEELNEEKLEELTEALNLCPFYENPILDVTPKCDIVFEDKTINWYKL